ncbi:YwiC-like family protein [Corynebacterium caspium]|uniref:YwiC-like family protein n=1 Tax=Corynebacterium caspium TaxID=234828 RepID=UPI000362657A|nr:YwiC-like family protein [Corynebacterium caspium]WKD59961.1 hypothetical protein CCASP_07930 [Corynebacterium caspium DSM 44850]
MSNSASTSKPVRKRKKGISPWIPNQHGAWAMLISPAVIGTVIAVTGISQRQEFFEYLLIITILLAWFSGYGAFFAFGLVAKARTAARKRDYLTPVLVYGGISLVTMLLSLFMKPNLAYWALVFGPLIGIAIYETIKGRSRSTLCGVSTTVASAVLIPVMAQVAMGARMVDIPWGIINAAIILALYFSGTIFYVKSMIRERNNLAFLKVSIGYHVFALLAAAAIWIWALVSFSTASTSKILILGVMAIPVIGMVWALYRAIDMPKRMRAGEKFTPKQVGLQENPLLLLQCFAVMAICVLLI